MKKAILFFGSNSLGLVKLRLNLMQDFCKLGYRVIACSPDDVNANQVKDELQNFDVEFIKISLNKNGFNIFNDFLAFINFYKILMKTKPDIVYLYNIKPVIYGSIASKIFGIRKIYSTITGLGSIFIGDKIIINLIRKFVEILYKIAFFCNTKVFFQNSDDLSLFVTKHIIAKEKVILVNGSGVDLNNYAVANIPKQIAFVMVARLIKDKGIYEYISACKILKSQYPQIKFYLVGNLDSNPTAISKEEFNNIVNSKFISYISGMTDIKKILKKSSIFVLPSYREGTPKSVLEAMAMGRPVITTNVSGCRETVTDKVNGYLIPVKDINALVNSMEKFILQPEIIPKMGKASRKIAERKYDVKKVNQTILNAMEISHEENFQAILEKL